MVGELIIALTAAETRDVVGSERKFRGISWETALYDQYEIILCWSEEDQAFIAEVPELPGCADGATRQEALTALESVISEWLETAWALGRAIHLPKGRLLYA